MTNYETVPVAPMTSSSSSSSSSFSSRFPPMESSHQDDSAVPAYTEVGATSLLDQLEALDAAALGLPLTRHPGPAPIMGGFGVFGVGEVSEEALQTWVTQDNLVTAFHSAITSRNADLVATLIGRGVVSPNVPSRDAVHPLVSAVESGSSGMVRCLVHLGADVDAFGTWRGDGKNRNKSRPSSSAASDERTALQVAAAKGNLVMVKLLVEECGADDGLIAPDGQLALRLAADAGHGEVVAYLPLRRGGEFRRWKAHHQVAMRRVRKALRKIGTFCKWVFFYPPAFLFWYLPRHAVYEPIRSGLVYCARNRKRFGGWCVRQVKAVPDRARRAAEATWRGVKKVPRAARAVGKALRGAARWLGRFLANLPGASWRALKTMASWLWNIAKKVGGAVGHVLERTASFIHTLFSAVVSFFRATTLRDVWDGFLTALHAIFVGFPKAVWEGIKSFGEMSYEVMKSLFGFVGKVMWWMARAVVELVQYVPRQLGVIVQKLGSSVRKGGHEILVWYNPKRGAV